MRCYTTHWLFCIGLALACPNYASAQVAVIAHESVPVDQISKSTLIDYYNKDINSWDNGHPVVLMDLKENDSVKDAFYKFIGKTSTRMKSIWLKKMLSGEGDPPHTISTENEMLKKVASTPGAIGFINHALIDPTVKTLLIIK